MKHLLLHAPTLTALKAGKPLDKNPFKDARVRKALSKAINRTAIVERVQAHGGVRVRELVQELGVSNMTIRRDLEALARQG